MKKRLKMIGLLIFILVVAVGCVVALKHMDSLKFDGTEEWLKNAKERIDRFGVFKWVIIFVAQFLQVLVAIIPGEPVEIFAGYMCGTFGGLLMCEAGALAGSVVIYLAVRKFGKRLVDKVADSKAISRMKFLNNTAKRDSVLFLLFFLPGTPKDILTYFAPLLKIDMWRFLGIVMVARIPSIISSTYVGATLSEGNLAFSVIIFAITGAVGAAGIIINDLYFDRKNKKVSDDTAKNAKND